MKVRKPTKEEIKEIRVIAKNNGIKGCKMSLRNVEVGKQTVRIEKEAAKAFVAELEKNGFCIDDCFVSEAIEKGIADIFSVYKNLETVAEAVEMTEVEEINEPHYVVQHRSETKKLGTFPSYKSASEWVDKNYKNYKGALGIYKVRVYDQEMTVKMFDFSGGRFVPGEVIHESSSAVVTYQGGSRDLKGEYKETEIDIEKKNADILIKYANGGSFTISVKPHVICKGRGVKKQYNSDSYEVTNNYLEKLKKNYSSVCDF